MIGAIQPKFLIQNAIGDRHRAMLKVTRKAHEQYCELNGYTFVSAERTATNGRVSNWAKIDLILEHLCGLVVWLDCDAQIIENKCFSLATKTDLGLVHTRENIFSSVYGAKGWYNTGVMVVRPGAKDFLEEVKRQGPMPNSKGEQATINNLLKTFPVNFERIDNCWNSYIIARSNDPVVEAFHGCPPTLREVVL